VNFVELLSIERIVCGVRCMFRGYKLVKEEYFVDVYLRRVLGH
jgi:hypothetical protein